MLIWNERRRLQQEKRIGPAHGKRPPVVENQQSSLTEPFDIMNLLERRITLCMEVVCALEIV
ncbi:MAG: hypothetical protein ACE3JN_04805 [Ectobacillus sp.]